MKKEAIQNDDYTPALLQYEIKTYLKISQEKLANILGVTPVAVSRAIKNDPALKKVRERIIQKIRYKK